ncbi:MAG: thioredoxin family protein [Sandaracinus sp.]
MGLLDKLFGAAPKVLPTSVRDRDAFEREVEKSETPVIVDVWGPACGPCKKMEPVLVDVATRYAGKVKVVEISTDAEPELLAELGVRATPTLIIYRSGEELGRSTGYRPGPWFDDMIAAELS